MDRRIVLDTNVVVSAMRSRRGASFRLLSLVGTGAFDICLSVPLLLEYEAKLLEQIDELTVSRRDIGKLLDYLASVALHQEVFFLWRPTLRDPKDDMVLELAVAAAADRIVTHNRRDFADASSFETKVVSPGKNLLERGLNQ